MTCKHVAKLIVWKIIDTSRHRQIFHFQRRMSLKT